MELFLSFGYMHTQKIQPKRDLNLFLYITYIFIYVGTWVIKQIISFFSCFSAPCTLIKIVIFYVIQYFFYILK